MVWPNTGWYGGSVGGQLVWQYECDCDCVLWLLQVYWCGPILGGMVAALLYESVFASNASLVKARGYLLASDYNSAKYQENKEKPYEIMENDEAALWRHKSQNQNITAVNAGRQ